MKLNTGRAIAPVLGGAMLAIAGNGPADAVQMCATCVPFIFNYTVGGTPFSAPVTPIVLPLAGPGPAGQVSFSDPSLIVQQFIAPGVPQGVFSDTGAFLLTNILYDPSATMGGSLGGALQPLPGTSGLNQLVIYYHLTGSLTGININFDTGGIIELYSETDYTSKLFASGTNIPQPDTSATPLAQFELINGSSTLTPQGNGKFQTSQFGFQFQQTAGAGNTFVNYLTGLDTFIGGVAHALLTGSAGVTTTNSLIGFHDCAAGELGDVTVLTSKQPVTGETFNTDPTGGLGTVQCSETSANGSFELSAVPEPGTLGLFGTGLLLLGFGARRRKTLKVEAV